MNAKNIKKTGTAKSSTPNKKSSKPAKKPAASSRTKTVATRAKKTLADAPGKNLSKRFNEFDADMKELKKNLRGMGYLDRPTGFVIFSWTYNIILAILPTILFFFIENWILKGAMLFLAGIGTVGIATCSHNASHNVSFKTDRVNRIMDVFGFDVMLGIASRFWDNFHNKLHHPNTSVVTIDPDTTVMPWFALHEKQIEQANPVAKAYYRIQGFFFPFLFGFYAVLLQTYGWTYLYKRLTNKDITPEQKASYKTDIYAIALHYVFWIGLFSLFFPLDQILIAYIGRSFVAGAFCFFALAPTHWARDALYFNDEILKMNYYSRQMFSTINYRVGLFGTLLANGVEYHLDHHLFPQVSPALLKDLSVEIDRVAKRHGMPYRSKGWPEIIWDSYLVILKPKVVDNKLIENYVTK